MKPAKWKLNPAARLRASAAWELVLLDRLSAEDRTALVRAVAPDTYGVLRPTNGLGTVKAVGPDAALLFLTLREPCILPGYVRASFQEDAEDAVSELLADGILEIEGEGGWISGPAAFQSSERTSARMPAHAALSLADRSQRAIRAAAMLPNSEPRAVESFLYEYGTVPIVRAREQQWGSSEAIRVALDLNSFPNPPSLSGDGAWWVFSGESGYGVGHCPKLYVGVAVSAIAEALRRILLLWKQETVGRPAFKIGASPHGLHRPDRMVFYPASVKAAALWGSRLTGLLEDLPADPVPFTAAVSAGGHVSWGADPPRVGRVWWSDYGSWRSHVTGTLAIALAASLRAGETEPWIYAAERARLAGINPDTWEPGRLAGALRL